MSTLVRCISTNSAIPLGTLGMTLNCNRWRGWTWEFSWSFGKLECPLSIIMSRSNLSHSSDAWQSSSYGSNSL